MDDLDRIARNQWGLVTRRQSVATVGAARTDYLIRIGRLLPVHRGVYRSAGAPITPQQQIAAVLLVMPYAMASHFSAASLHGLEVPKTAEVHVTVKRGRDSSRQSVVVHLSTAQPMRVQGLRCTSIERTFLDLAGELTERELRFAIEESVVTGKTTYPKIAAALERYGSQGRKGAAMLVEILKPHLPISEEKAGRIGLKVLRAALLAGLPEPETEYPVGRYFIDAAWPDLKIGAEADGYTVHTASRKRHNDDRRRRNYLQTQGWNILNFTHDMTLEEIADVLRANIASNL